MEKSHPFPFCDVSHHNPLTFLSSLSCSHSSLKSSSHSCVCLYVYRWGVLPLLQGLTKRVLPLESRCCLFISMNLTVLIALLLACLPVSVPSRHCYSRVPFTEHYKSSDNVYVHINFPNIQSVLNLC